MREEGAKKRCRWPPNERVGAKENKARAFSGAVDQTERPFLLLEFHNIPTILKPR